MVQGWGVSCPGRFISPPTQVFDVDFFSSPSFVQPKYKKGLALYSQDKPYKLVFNVGKEFLISVISLENFIIQYLGGGQDKPP